MPQPFSRLMGNLREIFRNHHYCWDYNRILISLSVIRHTYVCVSGGKKCSFFGKFGVLRFLETPVLRFALLAYYRRVVVVQKWLSNNHTKFYKSNLYNANFRGEQDTNFISCIILRYPSLLFENSDLDTKVSFIY